MDETTLNFRQVELDILPKKNKKDEVEELEAIKTRRKLLWLKIALELCGFLLLVLTILFVWQTINASHYAKKLEEKQTEEFSEMSMTDYKKGCHQPPRSEPLPSPFPASVQAALRRLDVMMTVFSRLSNVVGISANVVYRDKMIWSKSAGICDKNASTQIRVSGDTVFRVASLTKVFTAAMVFKMFENGKVSSLGDPMQKYHYAFRVQNPFNKEKITIRHLLSHMSGLPREAPCGPAWSTSYKNICPVDTDKILWEVSKMKLKMPPGTNPTYSNLGFGLLGRILEDGLSGVSYEDWINGYILGPLGMRNTGFDENNFGKHNIAHGYNDDGSEAPRVDWGWARPAAQIYTSTNDLAKFMIMLFGMSSENILSNGTLQEMFRPVHLYPDGTKFGMPWEMTQMHSYPVLFKFGYIPGYSATMALVPELKLGLNIVVSGSAVASPMASNMMKILIPAFKGALSKIQSKPKVPLEPEQYTGTYLLVSKWIDNTNYFVNITVEDNVLMFTQNKGFPRKNYLSEKENLVLEMIYSQDLPCITLGLGQNHELLLFEPSNTSKKLAGFKFGPFKFVRKWSR